jgi:hypothetical protein
MKLREQKLTSEMGVFKINNDYSDTEFKAMKTSQLTANCNLKTWKDLLRKIS